MAQRSLCLFSRRRRSVFLRFAEGFILGFFSNLALAMFAGCVWISRCSSEYGWGGHSPVCR